MLHSIHYSAVCTLADCSEIGFFCPLAMPVSHVLGPAKYTSNDDPFSDIVYFSI